MKKRSLLPALAVAFGLGLTVLPACAAPKAPATVCAAPDDEDDYAFDGEAFRERSECPAQEGLDGLFNMKTADYELRKSALPGARATFRARIAALPGAKADGGYVTMVRRVLEANMFDETDGDATQTTVLGPGDIDHLLEEKWKYVKDGFNEFTDDFLKDNNDADEEDDGIEPNYSLMRYAYGTSILPAWRWEAPADTLTTFCIGDDAYLGGAHGMNWTFYLTFSQAKDRVLGFEDFFTKEQMPRVIALLGQKLIEAKRKSGFLMPDEDVRPEVECEECTDAPNRSGQYEQWGGAWYPRPARTACGYVFYYPPYAKGCFAEGNIHVEMTDAEIAALK